MNSFEKYLQSKGLTKKTIATYNFYCLGFITWCDMQSIEVEDICKGDVTNYLQHLQKKSLNNATRSHYLLVLKHYVNYQINLGIRESNMIEHIKLRGTHSKKLLPILNKQELEIIYTNYRVPNKADKNNNRNWFTTYRLSKERNKIIIALLIYQGLKTSEINTITIQDVKLKEGKINIPGARKSNERELELKPQQIIELMEYIYTTRKELLEFTKDKNDYLFLATPPSGKKEIQNQTTERIWKRLTQELKTINPKLISLQQIRTSVITHWLSQFNIREVQQMSGHRYVTSTEAYKINQIDELQNDVEKYHPF